MARSFGYEEFFAALERDGVRYVVVGGLAMVLHGHARLTADIDLVVDLEPEAARRTIRTLTGQGLVPRAPVPADAFADPETRERWATERGMTVFNLGHPGNPLLSVDLFVRSPVPFDELWERSVEIPIHGGTVRVASIRDLIAMKRSAGRSQDSADIEALEAMLDDDD